MMKPLLLLLIGLSLLACEPDVPLPVLTEAERTANYEIALATELNTFVHPLTGTSPTLPANELVPFDYLANARIVGLGEATHGTREFFAFKHRLFRYLVEEHGYRALVFEMDFAEALFFDDYVRNGHGSPEQLMQDSMYLWLWQNEEVRDLLVWMREFNADRPAADQVRFLGNDAQTPRYNATALIRRLQQLDPQLAATTHRLTRGYRRLNRTTYRDAGKNRHHRIVEELRTVRDLLTNHKIKITALASEREYALLYQLSQNLLATEALLWSEHQAPYVNRRDLRLAINTQWWAERLGTKTVAWAHNLHVGDHPALLNSGAMGSYLKDAYGAGYQSIGFSFSSGSFLARGTDGRLGIHVLSGPPSSKSIHHYFDLAAAERFFLRRTDLPSESLTVDLLDKGASWHTVGAAYTERSGPNLIPLDFDGVVHLRSTSAARPLLNERD
ncbi:MAG: erythromycin esterase family protein [Bacteroidota bacterium]